MSTASESYNFAGPLNGGVDARTGLFSIAIALPPLGPNIAADPTLEMVLRYAPSAPPTLDSAAPSPPG
ncbi:hypothetical protein GCM10010302_05820 [Streptomyces polychromogenes]|uniref:Uncharacterized protein n=1 Tax=Streptomyces polychromogenes TaxID=67342 RepID=A0ABN0V1U6_9ACTN